jgi:hypothetical protein
VPLEWNEVNRWKSEVHSLQVLECARQFLEKNAKSSHTSDRVDSSGDSACGAFVLSILIEFSAGSVQGKKSALSTLDYINAIENSLNELTKPIKNKRENIDPIKILHQSSTNFGPVMEDAARYWATGCSACRAFLLSILIFACGSAAKESVEDSDQREIQQEVGKLSGDVIRELNLCNSLILGQEKIQEEVQKLSDDVTSLCNSLINELDCSLIKELDVQLHDQCFSLMNSLIKARTTMLDQNRSAMKETLDQILPHICSVKENWAKIEQKKAAKAVWTEQLKATKLQDLLIYLSSFPEFNQKKNSALENIKDHVKRRFSCFFKDTYAAKLKGFEGIMESFPKPDNLNLQEYTKCRDLCVNKLEKLICPEGYTKIHRKELNHVKILRQAIISLNNCLENNFDSKLGLIILQWEVSKKFEAGTLELDMQGLSTVDSKNGTIFVRVGECKVGEGERSKVKGQEQLRLRLLVIRNFIELSRLPGEVKYHYQLIGDLFVPGTESGTTKQKRFKDTSVVSKDTTLVIKYESFPGIGEVRSC